MRWQIPSYEIQPHSCCNVFLSAVSFCREMNQTDLKTTTLTDLRKQADYLTLLLFLRYLSRISFAESTQEFKPTTYNSFISRSVSFYSHFYSIFVVANYMFNFTHGTHCLWKRSQFYKLQGGNLHKNFNNSKLILFSVGYRI